MKKSLITLTCILSALCILLCGCSKSEAPEGYQNAAGDHEAFYFYVPTAWTLNNTGGTASAYYSTSDMSNVSMTCMVIEPETMDDLEEYKAITLAELESVLPDFKIFETVKVSVETTEESTDVSADILAIDGRETVTFEYECTLSGKTYKYMQAVTMKDDFFYIFTYASLAENYDVHYEEVRNIISYIDFK